MEWLGSGVGRLIGGLRRPVHDRTGERLVRLAARAVLRRAYLLHQTLILPDRVTMGLPPEEWRLFSRPALVVELEWAVRQEVRELSEDHVRRLSPADGRTVRVLMRAHLQLRVVEATDRYAVADYGDGLAGAGGSSAGGTLPAPPILPILPVATALPIPVPTPARTEELPPLATTLKLHHAVTPSDRRRLREGLCLVLQSDGCALGTAWVGLGPITVGRRADATLVVPGDKRKVSRQAVSITARGGSSVDARVENQFGARLCPPAWQRPSTAVLAGARVAMYCGYRLELDPAGTVVLHLERGHS